MGDGREVLIPQHDRGEPARLMRQGPLDGFLVRTGVGGRAEPATQVVLTGHERGDRHGQPAAAALHQIGDLLHLTVQPLAVR